MEHLSAHYFVKSRQFTARTHPEVYAVIDPTQAAFSQDCKVVIITCTSQGSGKRALVPSFAASGSKAIVLAARSVDNLKEVDDTTAKSHPDVDALVVPTDIGNPVSVTAIFESVKHVYGHANVLLKNAAILKQVASVRDIDPQSWREDIITTGPFLQTLNILGTFPMTQQFFKGLPFPYCSAKISTLTTGSAYIDLPTLSAYGISKLAILELMAYVDVENFNVVATALHPSIVDAEMTKESFKRFAVIRRSLLAASGSGLWVGRARSGAS